MSKNKKEITKKKAKKQEVGLLGKIIIVVIIIGMLATMFVPLFYM